MFNMKDLGFSQYCITKDGRVYSLKINRWITQQVSNNDYYIVSIGADNGTRYRKKVHRLLLQMFKPIDNCEDYFVNHIDGDKRNNSLENLEWVTPKENAEHALVNGLYKPTHTNHQTIFPEPSEIKYDLENPIIKFRDQLDDEMCHSIFQKLQDGYRKCDVARMLGVSNVIIYGLVKNPSKHIATILSEYDLSKQTRQEKTDIQTVIKACELLSQGFSATKTAKILEIHERIVMDIKARKRYLTVSSTYSW